MFSLFSLFSVTKNRFFWPEYSDCSLFSYNLKRLLKPYKQWQMLFWSFFMEITNSFSFLCQISMPGMMDTVLNLGLNDEVIAGLAEKSGERFAYDSYRRFLDMFGNVVSISCCAACVVD